MIGRIFWLVGAISIAFSAFRVAALLWESDPLLTITVVASMVVAILVIIEKVFSK